MPGTLTDYQWAILFTMIIAIFLAYLFSNRPQISVIYALCSVYFISPSPVPPLTVIDEFMFCIVALMMSLSISVIGPMVVKR